MNTTEWTILILAIFIVYFALCAWWLEETLNYNHTLNYFIFRRSLDAGKKGFIHYLEVCAIILSIFGLLTTFYSQIQIWRKNRKDRKVENREFKETK